MFGPKRNTAFEWVKSAVDALNLTGKAVAVVGGTDGLGRAIARLAAQQGADVTVIGRTNRDPGVPRITFAQADLSLMREAKKLGESGVLSPDLDVLVITTGIAAAPKREVTSEGIERDMAVSYLSRLAVLNGYLPRLKEARANTPLRIFVMGFPGSGRSGKLGDLNSEKKYSAIEAHMQTVAGNEALITYLNTTWGPGATRQATRAVEAYGLNPGLIKTRIRENMTGTGYLSQLLEWIIGKTSITPETYAGRIVPLLFSPELSGNPGLLFNQSADAILPTEGLKDLQHVQAFVSESQALIERGLSAQLS